MFLLNGKKISIDSQVTVDGTTWPNLRDPYIRMALGVIEVPDPEYPDPELYYWTENEDGSLVITPKPEEQIIQAANAKLLNQIETLEKHHLLPRVLREFLLEQPGAANKGWHAKVSAVDSEIAALKAKLK